MSEDLKARLLKARLPEDTVAIDGIGEIRVRGLSRGEVFAIQKVSKGTADFERRTLACGLVDPAMTEDEVRQWQDAAPAGELEPVGDKIRELSGLVKGADKSDLPVAGDEPGPGVRDVPGAEAGDDGGPAAGADEQ
jgi:hypothetical protein